MTIRVGNSYEFNSTPEIFRRASAQGDRIPLNIRSARTPGGNDRPSVFFTPTLSINGGFCIGVRLPYTPHKTRIHTLRGAKTNLITKTNLYPDEHLGAIMNIPSSPQCGFIDYEYSIPANPLITDFWFQEQVRRAELYNILQGYPVYVKTTNPDVSFVAYLNRADMCYNSVRCEAGFDNVSAASSTLFSKGGAPAPGEQQDLSRGFSLTIPGVVSRQRRYSPAEEHDVSVSFVFEFADVNRDVMQIAADAYRTWYRSTYAREGESSTRQLDGPVYSNGLSYDTPGFSIGLDRDDGAAKMWDDFYIEQPDRDSGKFSTRINSAVEGLDEYSMNTRAPATTIEEMYIITNPGQADSDGMVQAALGDFEASPYAQVKGNIRILNVSSAISASDLSIKAPGLDINYGASRFPYVMSVIEADVTGLDVDGLIQNQFINFAGADWQLVDIQELKRDSVRARFIGLPYDGDIIYSQVPNITL